MRTISPLTRQRARVIAEKVANGLTSGEIAIEMGLTATRVRKIADRFGIFLSRPHTRRFSFYCSRRRADLVKELALGAGVSPSVMIDRIVGAMVDDGVPAARRKMGKLALPPKPEPEGRTHVV